MADRPVGGGNTGFFFDHGSKPEDLRLQVFGTRSIDMHLGKYTITMVDLAYMLEYIFTNVEVTTEYDIRIFIKDYIEDLTLMETEGDLRHFVAPEGGQMRDLLKTRAALMGIEVEESAEEEEGGEDEQSGES